jgi:hypothetical protein
MALPSYRHAGALNRPSVLNTTGNQSTMNTTRKTLLLGLCITAGAITAPAVQAARFDVGINIAPPEPRIEIVPAARVGYVWAPGYWDYRGGSHVWVGGRWRGERHGYHWAPDHWEQHGNRWHRNAGHWEH